MHYCPHLDPIERLWRLMHRHVTHNATHATFKQLSEAVLTFLREEARGNGEPSVTRSPTISGSSHPRIFGL